MTVPHIPHPGGGRDLPTGPAYDGPGMAIAATAKTSRSTAKIVLAAVAGLLALCCAGGVVAAIAGSDDPTRPVSTQDDANRQAATAPSTSATAAPTTSAPATTKSAPPAKPVKTTPPPVILTDGIYLVGEDIPAGRYKVVERAGSDCYWSRTDADDPSNIIANSIGGGFPQFTAKRGEQIEISRCPDFRKIK